MKNNSFLYINIIFSLLISPFCSFDFTLTPWEDGIIPYYLSGEFTQADLDNLTKAMDTWESVCGVRFISVTPRANAYEIIHNTQHGWYSTIGENNSQCYMSFNASDNEINSIIHELGHCLGLFHEHQRPDRDNYIEINWDKIVPGREFNFYKMDNPLVDEGLFEYDYSSIMHYPQVSFSLDGSPTIVPKNGHGIINNGLSETDIQKARLIYGEPLSDDDIEEY
ncbi:MAG: M12 family metallopeptidase [Spirochaetes bacterium]|jgi:hypothetical protein|nr:M12 family metallopeptidase [Spirochaetota bacterium]